jgi:hypothetical protein
MCQCKSEIGTHELFCEDWIRQSDPVVIDLSFRQDKERANQRNLETTSYFRRRVLAQANGSAKVLGLTI